MLRFRSMTSSPIAATSVETNIEKYLKKIVSDFQILTRGIYSTMDYFHLSQDALTSVTLRCRINTLVYNFALSYPSLNSFETLSFSKCEFSPFNLPTCLSHPKRFSSLVNHEASETIVKILSYF